MKLTLTGYSTALYATWYFIEELGLLFDAGDGLMASLLSKARKIEHAFISHPDRDHLAGLLQFNALNARPGFPIIYYPADSASFPNLATFTKNFDPQVSGTVWTPITQASSISIRKDMYIETIRNGHVRAAEGVTKSLSYKLFQTKEKLRPEYASLSGEEIKNLIMERGKENMIMQVKTNLLSYSGDTPVEDPLRYDHSQILIHEATFLGDDADDVESHGNKHSTLEEVMEMVSGIHIEKLVLGHFSSRYSAERIDNAIRTLCDKYAINVPVYRILPGLVARDILSERPING
jgi:ribonuclease Z